MSYMGNGSRGDVEYGLSLQERKKDAQLMMKQTAKIMNGDVRVRSADEVVGMAKGLKSKK